MIELTPNARYVVKTLLEIACPALVAGLTYCCVCCAFSQRFASYRIVWRKSYIIAFKIISCWIIATSLVYAKLPSLIPREVLFGNPTQIAARLSPDGKYYSYLAPSEQGVLNIWVQDIAKTKSEKMITQDQHRGIHQYQWAEDNQHILYIKDKNGDENWHLYSINLLNLKTTDLTPFEGVRADSIFLDKKHPTEVLVSLNKRDLKVFDIYRINLQAGSIRLDTQNPGNVVGWQTDSQFQVRAALSSNNEDGSTSLQVRATQDAPWKTIGRWPFGESIALVGFTGDGKNLYIVSSLGTDTTQLQEIDANTGKLIKIVASYPHSDVDNVLVDEDQQILAVQWNYLKPTWQVIQPNLQDDFKKLIALFHEDFSVVSQDRSNNLWIIATMPADQVPSYYLYDRTKKEARFLFVAYPQLTKYKLAAMQPLIIKARDGLSLPSYLTLPVGVAPKNLPLVLNVHGGPWARDHWGYNPEAQWLANRGYAVLQVNYRGSSGFGKKFLNAGDGQWGVGAMQNDLSDAVTWAINKGIADPKRICIYGGSYGGYATLAGLVFTPNLYTCGVDIVGPADLKTLVASIPAYWEPSKKQLLLRIGNVEKDAELNRKISPLYHVANIRVPLLIAQGKNDPRVKMQQADSIVKAMRDKKLDVLYVIYEDEGHGFVRPENRLDFYGRAEKFLANYLQGRVQPWEKVPGALVKVG